jgi:hypothetical protein
MVALTSRRLIHNLNEIRLLESDYFVRLGKGPFKTAKVCGSELNALALHYKKHVGSRRLGMGSGTCREIADHFNRVAEAMDHLFECIQVQPPGIQTIFKTYEHGHAAWSLDGCKRSSDAKNIVMQLWHDGHASDWFLPEPPPAEAEGTILGVRPIPLNRLDELNHLAGLMRQLSDIYLGLQDQQRNQPVSRIPFYDEKDALVFNLAELIRKQARPGLHTVEIATSIHAWATGDLNPPQARFQAAYQNWKERPRPATSRSRP